MKLMSEKLPDLEALYIKQLRVLLSAEEINVRGAPRMAESATDPELKQVLRSHVDETERHALRLRSILEGLPGDHDLLKCRVMSSLIDEAADMMEDAEHDSVRDAAIIAAAQRIEHYEIAAYGAVRHFARVLGREQDVAVLSQTINEEGNADHHLTHIAERVNPTARKAA